MENFCLLLIHKCFKYFINHSKMIMTFKLHLEINKLLVQVK